MFLIFLIWILSGLLLYNIKDRGTFGDMFGAVNSLFSGLAFIGVIFAVLLQKKELELQRKELNLTREEIKGQKEQLKAQNETFQLQNFENTFFQLIRLHNNIVNDLDTGSSSKPIRGRDCFEHCYNRILKTIFSRQKKVSSVTNKHVLDESYRRFFIKTQQEFGHYFRNIYSIMKFIDNSNIENKKHYFDILKSLLSTYESTILFYHSLSIYMPSEFKKLFQKYSIIDFVDTTKLLDKDHIDLFLDKYT